MKSVTIFRQAWLTCLLLVGLVSVLFTSCEDTTQVQPQPSEKNLTTEKHSSNGRNDGTKTFYGPATPMGQGVARAWVSVDHDGDPLAIGINFSARSIMTFGDHHEGFLMTLPKQGKLNITPFDHITLDWNPHGHPPFGTYDVPHFDIHFYMLSVEERMTIPGIMPPYMDTPPAAQYIPPGYIQTPGVEQAMGVHWPNVMSGEFQPGGSFTNTLILGSYQGEWIFIEPMVTLSYLLSKPNETRNIPQAEAVQVSGYYPTKYTVRYTTSPAEYQIILHDLVYREAL